MADSKITDLTGYSPPLDADIFPLVDITTTTTKKITWANLKTTLNTLYLTKAGILGGQIAIGGTAITNILKLQGTSGNGTLTSPAVQILVGNNGGTIGLTVLNNGSIGIGTTSPGAKLHIYQGSPTANQILFQIGTSDNATRFSVDEDGDVEVGGTLNATTATITHVYAVNIRTNGSLLTLASDYDANGTGSIAFTNSNVENMRLGPMGGLSLGTSYVATDPGAGNMIISGNVGIGTTGPASLLHLYSSSNNITETLETSGTGNAVYLSLSSGSDANLTLKRGMNTRDARLVLATGATTDFHIGLADDGDSNFYIGDENFANKWVTVEKTSGNVGIGTTAPTAKLHLPAAQAGANLASLKIPSGVVATTPVAGNVEADSTHIYWTKADGTRLQLD